MQRSSGISKNITAFFQGKQVAQSAATRLKIEKKFRHVNKAIENKSENRGRKKKSMGQVERRQVENMCN